MTERNKINVLIDGRNFTVIGNGSEEYVRKLAYYVDEKIRDMTSKNDKLSGSMAATLAALNITDELYRVSIELKSLKSETKAPMQEYDTIVSQLEESKTRIEELCNSSNVYKDKLLETQMENERLNRSIEKQMQALDLKEKELQDSQNMIKKLQDKIFDNQIELIEIKKELEEALRSYDNEKNLFIKEEI